MGRHRKPSRLLTGATAGAAAAPALAGVAAAFCLTQPPPQEPAVLPDIQHVAMAALSAPAGTYTVQPGDTLSGIAGRVWDNPAGWTEIYGQNRQVIGGDPNLILAGERLTVGAEFPSRPVQAVPAQSVPRLQGTYGHPYYCGDGDGDGFDMPCWKLRRHDAPGRASASPQAPVQGYQAPAAPVQAPVRAVSYTGSGGFQSCVIARESGGNSQVMNSSGHYGLYQFAAGTWAAAGGNPGDFGHASVAEQNQVFASAYAKWGTQPWAGYDGC
jgi:transglycosylase-like protein/LysM domain-containing protein